MLKAGWANVARIAQDFMGEFTQEQLIEIFPKGPKTPAAVWIRAQAECGLTGPIDAADVHAFIVRVREDPEYQPGKGHKRAALMAFIAVAAGACCQNPRLRDPSDNMIEMAEKTWSPHWRAQFMMCLRWGHGRHENEGAKPAPHKLFKDLTRS